MASTRAKWGIGAVLLGIALAGACPEPAGKLRGIDGDGEGDATTTTQPPPDGGSPVGPPTGEQCPPICTTPAPGALARRPGPNPIPEENQRPGDPSWRAGRPAHERQVELYTSTDSVLAGETVSVKVSADGPVQVTAEVFRLGHYGGAGARKVWSGGPFAVQKQVECPRDPITSRVECAWAETFSFTVGEDWVTGLYLVKVTRPDGRKRFAPFVVRDTRAAELLFQFATNRHQAYNIWGGESLYVDASGTMPSGRAHHVSYDRPYREGEGAGHLLHWEVHFVRLLEARGYDVTYAASLDFERHPDLLEGIGAFVHAGHDEYWTENARNQVDRALASGRMSLAYFGANGAYWRVRTLSNTQGVALRTLACYKNDVQHDPQPGSTVRFRDAPDARPENGLLGSMYDGWQLIPFALTVRDPGHWLFAGTGLRAGEQLHGLLGYEFDRVWDNGHTPSGLSVSMESPVVTAEGVPNVSHMVDFTHPSGRPVFSAGTIYWPLALSDDPELHDARVVRMTENVLERALAHRRAPRTLGPLQGSIPQSPAPIGTWATSVQPYAGQVSRGGYRDGPAATALFDGPTGLAVLPTGEVVVADTRNQRIRLVGTDAARTVTTIAGNGQLGLRDGQGLQAMFRMPTGVAVLPDGSVLVADSDNHNIRRLVRSGMGWTVSTWAGFTRIQGYADGPPSDARFRRPTALAVDGAGNAYVADQAGNRVRRVDGLTREVTTVAGSGTPGFADAPDGLQARFNNPSAVVVGTDGAVYVIDGGNQRLRRITLGGARAVTSLAGSASMPFGFADGAGSQARFRAQMGLLSLPTGELLVADTANFRIRQVVPGADAESTRVTTMAGTGRLGARLGTGAESDIVAPTGLALLPDGGVVVSDSYNNTLRVIRR